MASAEDGNLDSDCLLSNTTSETAREMLLEATLGSSQTSISRHSSHRFGLNRRSAPALVSCFALLGLAGLIVVPSRLGARPAATHERRDMIQEVGAAAVPAAASVAPVPDPAPAFDVAPAAPAAEAVPAAAAPPPCSENGKNCMHSKCCAVAGHQCYEKNGVWSACRTECSPGPDPTDPDPAPWTCKTLGEKTLGSPPPPDYTLKPAKWVAASCAGPGANCSASRCCKEPGHSCYLKVDGWAACKAECYKGPDPTDTDAHPWDCKVLGMRTPGAPGGWRKASPWVADKCSAKGENCKTSRCCKDPGHQCFLKQGNWAMCMPHCTKGPLLTDENPDIWECKALGGPTPGTATTLDHLPMAPWVKTKCAAVGENCSASMCCSEETMQCYEKDASWAGCLRGCKPGVHPGDPAGGPWSCKEMGPRTPRKWKTPSLYCWSVIRLNAESSEEASILRYQVKTNGGIGIFGCDLADVFASDGEGWIGDGPNGPVWTHHFEPAPVGITVDHTAANTQLFLHVWSAVRKVGKYMLTDFTVKVDPDAVLIADRLRGHLLPYRGQQVYVKNCNSPTLVAQGPMMFGSVEAISKQGLEKFYLDGGACQGNFQWGEDRWIGNCFDKIAVRGVGDWTMEGDKLCLGVGVGPDCSDKRAAYHPYKSLAVWTACYNQAAR